MVKIITYKSATNAEGEEFFMLVVQGGVESVLSKETERFYLTAKKATVSSTFDEETCRGLVGTQLPGGIERVEVDPFTYVDEETGEQFELDHRNVYNPELITMEEAVLETAPQKPLEVAQ
jgi:hypothetical protein